MESATKVQIMNEAFGISLCANAEWKSMNPSIFAAALQVNSRVDEVLEVRLDNQYWRIDCV